MRRLNKGRPEASLNSFLAPFVSTFPSLVRIKVPSAFLALKSPPDQLKLCFTTIVVGCGDIWSGRMARGCLRGRRLVFELVIMDANVGERTCGCQVGHIGEENLGDSEH